MHRISWFSVLVCLALELALGSAPAQAQEKPFKIFGSGVGPNGLPLPGQDARMHWARGTATHLGRYYGEGTVRTDTAVPTATGFAGLFGSGDPFVFVAANGDKLATFYGRTDKGASTPGRFELTIVGVHSSGAPIVTALWIAEFVAQPTLSTGRFAGVTGSWVMIAKSKPFVLGSSDPVEYEWEGEGRLRFPKGK